MKDHTVFSIMLCNYVCMCKKLLTHLGCILLFLSESYRDRKFLSILKHYGKLCEHFQVRFVLMNVFDDVDSRLRKYIAKS